MIPEQIRQDLLLFVGLGSLKCFHDLSHLVFAGYGLHGLLPLIDALMRS
jgi:hypothetical protein